MNNITGNTEQNTEALIEDQMAPTRRSVGTVSPASAIGTSSTNNEEMTPLASTASRRSSKMLRRASINSVSSASNGIGTSPSSTSATPSVFTFDDEGGKPKTRAQSPFFDPQEKTPIGHKASSTYSPAANASENSGSEGSSSILRKTDTIHINSLPSPASSLGKPPASMTSPQSFSNVAPDVHSPIVSNIQLSSPNNNNTNNLHTPFNILLSKPLELTKVASSQSYLLKYSRTRKPTPWQRLVKSPISNPPQQQLQQLPGAVMVRNSHNDHSEISSTFIPQSISVALKKRHLQKDRSNSVASLHEAAKENEESNILNNINDNESSNFHAIQNIVDEDHDNCDDNDSTEVDEEELDMDIIRTIRSRSRSDDLYMLQQYPPSSQNTDDSIFRCDTPIMRNRLKDDNDDRDGGGAKSPITTTIMSKTSTIQEEETIKPKNSIDNEIALVSNNLKTVGTIDTQISASASIFSFFRGQNLMSIIYLAAFAIIGSSIRVYFSRLFGYDCEFPPSEKDYLTFFTTCVTASGLTEQTGGALFIDLPANMFGSFILGIMTPSKKDIPALPWLKYNHSLQSNGSMHTSIRTGFCGSLTTFSSWNTQMIIMMVGRGTVLGSQVVPALMGYILGMILAISSFLSGRRCANALYNFRHPNGEENLNQTQDIEAIDQNSVSYTIGTSGNEAVSSRPMFVFLRLFSFDRDNMNGVSRDSDENSSIGNAWKGILKCVDRIIFASYSPIIFTVLIVTAFLVADFAMGSKFHRVMWVSSFLAPLGTIIRWMLSFQNGKWFQQSEIWKYLPVGTLLCNILACMLSALCAALSSRVGEDSVNLQLLLTGAKVGFAGNLSTVSTFVKEVVHLSEKPQTSLLPHLYAVGTIVICCLASLCVYVPIKI